MGCTNSKCMMRKDFLYELSEEEIEYMELQKTLLRLSETIEIIQGNIEKTEMITSKIKKEKNDIIRGK